MHAVVATRPGRSEVLEPVELPDPQPSSGEVLVAVEAAAITFIDTQMRAGTGPRPLPVDAFPVVLGNGVGGTVIALGESVDPAWLGAAVVTATGGRGGYASRAVAAAADLHRIPDRLGLRDAVALLADGRTALGLARAAGMKAGDTVAVTAAAGGVGGILVQLAGNAGAHVVALAGDEGKLEHARGLGAGTAINYRRADWTDALKTATPDGLDIAFDGVGGATTAALADHMNRGGRLLPHGAASGTMAGVDGMVAAERGITVIPLSAIGAEPGDLYELVEQALGLAAAGAIRAVIGQTYPLAEAAAAHAAIEARATLGKTLLIP